MGVAMFMRKKEKMERIHLDNLSVEMRIDTTIAKQIEMLQMTESDLKFLKAFQPYVEQNIEEIVGHFYRSIGMETSLIKIIDDHSSIERLKTTLKKHIGEMFNGQIDEQFFLTRQRIAQVHVHIGLPTKYYIGAFQNLFISLMEIVQQKIEHPEDQFATLRAISKILNFEQQIVLEEFENVVQKAKLRHEEQKQYISQQIIGATENLVAISEQTSASVHQLHQQSEDVVHYAEEALQISSEAKDRAQEGNIQIKQSLQQMEQIIHSVEEIAGDVNELVAISKEMEGIIAIVTNIADQTNLLSLNAAIEAARAGEAGKGFSIVAGEVRNLSEQTKQSTKNVATLLQSSNIQTEKLLNSMQRIQTAVSLGEQGLATTAQRFTQILSAMEEQQQKNSLVGQEVHVIGQVIDDLGSTFNEVSHSVDSLATVAKDLV